MTVSDEFLGVRKSNHLIGSAMENEGAELNGSDRPELLPGRAKKHEPRMAGAQVHRKRAASTRPDNNVGRMRVESVLRNAKRLRKIVVRKAWIEDFVASVLKECRFHASGNGLPPMQEQNPHSCILGQATERSVAVRFAQSDNRSP